MNFDENDTVDDKLHEECGVFGIYAPEDEQVAHTIYYGLGALQHRGQEAAGMAVCNTRGPMWNVSLHKEMGLVNEVFHGETLDRLIGNLGVGHVRYSTTGESNIINAQPLVFNYFKGTLALVHNGNITNAKELKEDLIKQGAVFFTSTDSEVIACEIAINRTETDSVEQAIINTAHKLKGGYALIVMSPRKLIGVRDPLGLKPLCLGKRKDSYILASESCALASVDAEQYYLACCEGKWIYAPLCTEKIDEFDDNSAEVLGIQITDREILDYINTTRLLQFITEERDHLQNSA